MDILAGAFHYGWIVDDLTAAMARVGPVAAETAEAAAGGANWAPVRAFDPLPVWTPETGRGEIRLWVTYSRPGPLRIELIQSAPDTPYDALRAIGRSHVGVWVDNVGAGVDALCAQGWRLLLAGASPRHRYGSMAYLARDGGPVVELVGRELVPMMQAWWNE